MKNTVSRELMFLVVVAFLFNMIGQVINPVLTLYMIDVGASAVEVGLMLAVSFLVGVVARIPSGIASDRFGKTPIILIAFITQFFSLVLLYIIPHPIWFYLVLGVQTLPMALFWSPAAALASDIAPLEKRGEAMGRYFTAFGLAMFLGPLLCSFLVAFLSYRTMLLVLLPLPLLSLVVFVKGGIARQNIAPTKQYNTSGDSVIHSLKTIFRSRNIKALYVTSILNAIPLAVFAAIFSIYAQETLFFTPTIISLLFTARGGANALIRIPVGRISDKIGSRKKPLIMSYILLALVYFIISMTGNYFLLVLAMVVFGFGWGIRAAVGNTLLVESVNSENRGLALSIYNTIFTTGQFLGSSLVGVMVPILTATEIFKLSSLYYLLGILILTIAVSEKTRAQPRGVTCSS